MTIPARLTPESTSDQYAPRKEDRFSFGLWTVGNQGRDPFGDVVRPSLNPIDSVKKLSELGAWGVNFHDNDLVPFHATPAERDRIVHDFKQALSDYGMVVQWPRPISSFIPSLKMVHLQRLTPAFAPSHCKKRWVPLTLP